MLIFFLFVRKMYFSKRKSILFFKFSEMNACQGTIWNMFRNKTSYSKNECTKYISTSFQMNEHQFVCHCYCCCFIKVPFCKLLALHRTSINEGRKKTAYTQHALFMLFCYQLVKIKFIMINIIKTGSSKIFSHLKCTQSW